MASVPNHPPIHSFTPNSDAKAAAECVVGLAGLGIIAEWSYDDDGPVTGGSLWTIRERGAAETIGLSSKELRWYAKGALACLRRFQPSLAERGDLHVPE